MNKLTNQSKITRRGFLKAGGGLGKFSVLGKFLGLPFLGGGETDGGLAIKRFRDSAIG